MLKYTFYVLYCILAASKTEKYIVCVVIGSRYVCFFTAVKQLTQIALLSLILKLPAPVGLSESLTLAYTFP